MSKDKQEEGPNLFEDFLLGADQFNNEIEDIAAPGDTTDEEEKPPASTEEEKEDPSDKTDESTSEEEVVEDDEVVVDEEKDNSTEGADDSETEEGESDLPVSNIIEVLHETNGWEFDAEKFGEASTVEDLMEFIGDVVESNSVPQYASEETKAFDEFVSKYGVENASKFLKANHDVIDYDSMDLENDGNKKALYTDYLKQSTKFSDAKIAKEVSNKIDTGEIDDELEEAKSYLANSQEERKVNVEKESEAAKAGQAKSREAYINSQRDRINGKTEIAGFDITEKDKGELFDFIYKEDNKGATGYSKLRENDPDLDLKLLMLAFKGVDKDKIIKVAETAAVKKLRASLSRKVDTKMKPASGAANPKKKDSKGDSSKTNYTDFIL